MTEEKPKEVKVVKALEGMRNFKRLDGTTVLQRELLVMIEGEPGLYTHWSELPTINEKDVTPENDNKKD